MTEHKICIEESNIFGDHASEKDRRVLDALCRRLEVYDWEVILAELYHCFPRRSCHNT
jgi:hypothetical protein